MTDQQIRSAIAGALSVSMMPMETEEKCIAFLDACLDQRWRKASEELPKMHTDVFEDFDDYQEFEVSDTVLVFTEDGEIVPAKCCFDTFGRPWWFSDEGTDYNVTHWRKLPKKPEV